MTTGELTLTNGHTVTGVKPMKSLNELLKNVKTQERLDKVLIVLLDSSGSMSESLESSSKISLAWHVLKDELMPNMNEWNYGVVIFSEHVDWEVYPMQDTRALAVRRMPSAGGGTSMMHTLVTAWEWVRINAKQARFILISDGVPTDSSTGAILNTANKSIPIDTVGIGNEGSYGYDKEFLQELSRITGGIFTEALSVKMLAEAILKLSPSVRPLLGEVK